jgi:NitT/TauT family transport system permease protein
VASSSTDAIPELITVRRGPKLSTETAKGVAIKSGYVIGLLVAWEVLPGILGIRSYLLPPFSAVMAELLESLPIILEHTMVTTTEALIGLALAGVVGLLLSIVIVYSPTLRSLALPTLVAFNAVPKVAFAPLLVIWLGLGLESKVAMAFLIAFFPIVVNSTTGMADVEPELLNLLRLMRASERQTFQKVRLPHALPAIFDGFRIALPLAIIGALVGEFVAASEGLGYLIIVAGIQLNTELVFGCVLVIAVLSLLLYGVLAFVEGRTLRWRPAKRMTA